MITRRGTMAAGLAAIASVRAARAADVPGAGGTTLKVGNTMPYSGPASAYAALGYTEAAFFKSVNDQGGVAGRRIDFISLDDGYSPPRTVQAVRQLVEQDQVAFLFQTLGTPTNSAIVEYVNKRQIPHLFLASGASKWSDYKRWPWTMGWQPSYRAEARIYARYVLAEVKDPRIAILYQSDSFGRDYLDGARDVLGPDWSKRVAGTEGYEFSDAAIDSQVAALQDSGANTLIVAATPRYAVQAIRKVRDLNWKPAFFLTNVSTSPALVMVPAGAENGTGIVTAGYFKDPTDPAWANDVGMNEWRGFMAQSMPGASLNDTGPVVGYGASRTLLQVLRQCEGDFSRPSVMRQAESLRQVENPVLLPGITISTSHTDHRPIKTMQLMRWTGEAWDRFGGLIEDAET
ncbi:MAG TPA: ABC transporter substrate-binding protein [Acetobacteraceae bacterium]|nr:ABC transporter substrate-binding protein [Acetobacteraceae bacterium]